MPSNTRDRAHWQRRSPEGDGRARRAAEAQQAAYEASRAVLAVAARRRDAAWRHAARGNRRRAAAALAAPLSIAIVLMALGAVSTAFLIAGAAIACVVAAVSSVVWVRSAGVLARQLGGTVVTAERRPSALGAAEAARLVDVAEGLFAVFGLPGAEIRVLDDPAPNSISVGSPPQRGVVFVTSGLVLALDRIELEAVLAHELAHIKRGDTVSGAIAVLAFDPIGRHVPLFARFGDKVAGNARETIADLAAVGVTRYPPGLISALEKIAAFPSRRPECLSRSVTESTSRLWLAPFDRPRNDRERFGTLDLDERVAVLREL
ncbi:MAG: M48 family metalloprotease [Acidimicrobiales bacterium]